MIPPGFAMGKAVPLQWCVVPLWWCVTTPLCVTPHYVAVTETAAPRQIPATFHTPCRLVVDQMLAAHSSMCLPANPDLSPYLTLITFHTKPNFNLHTFDDIH